MSPRRRKPATPPRDAIPGITRRAVLEAAAAAACAYALPACGGRRAIEGRIVGPSDARGHLLRGGAASGPVTVRDDVPVLVVGGGVAGLSAAWKLVRAGFTDLRLLELEDALGGTAAGGRNAVSAYPLGAHYLPVPTRDERAVAELLTEMGILRGFDPKGRALVDEASLCRAPQERLFVGDQWYEGLFPKELLSAEDQRQMDAFQARVATYAARRDDAGRRAFAIPVAHSARDPDLLALDGISMARWLDEAGITAPRVRWTVEYACRDDFGARLEGTSAWAGLHYFAARIPVPGDDAAPFLTWPEGNARLVRHLARSVEGRTRTGVVVLAVEPAADRVRVRWLDVARGTVGETTAEHVICALPRFVARRVVAGLRKDEPAFVTSPWVVANLTLTAAPDSAGYPLAWDNVLYDSDSLGYVVATHQADRAARDTVWTWYRAYGGPDPAADRRALLAARWEDWRDLVLADLAPAHEGLEACVASIDVMRWGHGMVRPGPGFLWGAAREAAARPLGRVHFAAADLGGLALFEEAQWAGVRAAEEVLAARGVAFTSSL